MCYLVSPQTESLNWPYYGGGYMEILYVSYIECEGYGTPGNILLIGRHCPPSYKEVKDGRRWKGDAKVLEGSRVYVFRSVPVKQNNAKQREIIVGKYPLVREP